MWRDVPAKPRQAVLGRGQGTRALKGGVLQRRQRVRSGASFLALHSTREEAEAWGCSSAAPARAPVLGLLCPLAGLWLGLGKVSVLSSAQEQALGVLRWVRTVG